VTDWKRLGTVVTAERIRRGHKTLNAFARASGLSRSTLDSIEAGRKTSYSPVTIATLENALGWQAGSVQRVLKGLAPLLEEDPYLEAVHAAWPRLTPGQQRVVAILTTEMARGEP
jgi:transcriptional regulator with XRE-family HTH domain